MRNEALVIIPAFNEAVNIGHTLRKIPKKYDILVIDDGSTDDTRSICQQLNVNILSHKINLGYEKALTSGIKYFQKHGYCRFVVVDADGELSPNDALDILDKISDRFPVICGFRTEFYGRISERLASIISRRVIGITDPFCGCKAFHRSILSDTSAENLSNNAFTNFVISYCRKNEVINMPISGKKRAGKSSYGNGLLIELKIIIKFLKSFQSYLLQK
jgi:glycosyltransferase involved in cell wall biosynthesis